LGQIYVQYVKETTVWKVKLKDPLQQSENTIGSLTKMNVIGRIPKDIALGKMKYYLIGINSTDQRV